MKNIEFATLFNHLCKESGNSDLFIAEKLGVDRATVGRWRKGESSPKLSILPVIAKYFNFSMDIFTQESNIDEFIANYKKTNIVTSDEKKIHNVPVFARIPAGTPFEAIQERLGDVEIPEKLAKKANLFGLKIVGDSMNKVIPNGCIAVFEKCSEVTTGEIALIIVNDDDAIVRHFYNLQNGHLLEPDSFNDAHKPRIITETNATKVIGKLIWYCMDLEQT